MPTAAEQPLWWALWSEGLASYVSWQLNPTLTAPEIFWNPRDMEAQLQPKLADAARLLLADLDGPRSVRPLVPRRLDLTALARMPPRRVAVEARKYRESLAEK